MTPALKIGMWPRGAAPRPHAWRELGCHLGTPPSVDPTWLRRSSRHLRPLTMETSKMLAMEPMAARATTRSLSRQFSHTFITRDSQHGTTSLSDSMACAAVGARGNMEAVTAWISNRLSCSLLLGCLKLGPRLIKSNLEYVILQGSQFHRTKWRRENFNAAAAGWTMCHCGPVSGCSLRPTTSSSEV